MPFIGQDWRSPGDQWVRTSEGWEKMRLWRVKIFENLNQNAMARLLRLAVEDQDCQQHLAQDRQGVASRRQPHVFFNNRGTKENLELTCLSESLVRLDIAGAARDLQRANYVIKLMAMVFEEKLPSLSGTSQKLIFNILESIVNEALVSELNIGVTKDLLEFARTSLYEGKHHHIGSPALWERHSETVDRLAVKMADYQMKQRDTDGGVMICDLPAECLREIFLQIADHKDVMRAAQANTTLNEVTEESLLWKKLCLHHFSNIQIMTFLLPSRTEENKPVDWKHIYRRCFKRFGKKESYADMLAICTYCSCIHWMSLGHPCIGGEKFEAKPLSPKDFLSLFRV
ncbi:F box only protein 32 [Elysia marginata]|uniref:F box only protein 32 n=1 Tax=Elysia marginata TaxID=1093978 RepID=A0AAV4JSB9_9GAST|nr:F box only protein 32 [Elysia marginata]